MGGVGKVRGWARDVYFSANHYLIFEVWNCKKL